MHRTNTGTYIHYMTRLCMMQLTDLATAAVAKEIPACLSLVCFENMQRNPDHHRPQLESSELITSDGLLCCLSCFCCGGIGIGVALQVRRGGEGAPLLLQWYISRNATSTNRGGRPYTSQPYRAAGERNINTLYTTEREMRTLLGYCSWLEESLRGI